MVVTYIDRETGNSTQKMELLEYPDAVKFNLSFVKVNPKRINTLSPTLIGHLILLSENLEYQTNRLTISSTGVSAKVMNIEHISKHLDISLKQTKRVEKDLINSKSLFIIDNTYWINPTFISKGTVFYTHVLDEMIEQDPDMLTFLHYRDRKKLGELKSAQN